MDKEGEEGGMICTKCGESITKSGYFRTKRGVHHFECGVRNMPDIETNLSAKDIEIRNLTTEIENQRNLRQAEGDIYAEKWLEKDREIEVIKADLAAAREEIKLLTSSNAQMTETLMEVAPELKAAKEEITKLRAELAKRTLKWKTGKPPKDAIYFVKSQLWDVESPEFALGRYCEDDGLIASESWSVDPLKTEWAGPIHAPEE